MQQYLTFKTAAVGIILILAGLLIWSFGLKGTEPLERPPLSDTEQAGSEDAISPTPATSPFSPTAAPPAPAVQGNAGRIIVAIKDLSTSINDIDSIFMTIHGVEVHSPKTGWVSLSGTAATYDLLALKRDGRFERMIDRGLTAGTYDGLRLPLGPVTVVKNGIAHPATVLTTTFYIPFTLVVGKDHTSALLLDVLADSSLHITEDGTYVFAPTIHVSTLSDIETTQVSGIKIQIFGGTSKFDAVAGTDENGVTKAGTGLDRTVILDLAGKILVLMPRDIDRSGIAVSADDAIDRALAAQYLTTVTSVRLLEQGKQIVWLLVGTRAGTPNTVAIDSVTGALTPIE